MKFDQIRNNLEKYWRKILGIGGGFLIIMGIIDYFIKFSFVNLFKNIIQNIFSFILSNPFDVFLIIWLIIISCIIFCNRKNKEVDEKSKEGLLKKVKEMIEEDHKKILEAFRERISTLNSKVTTLTEENLDRKRDILNLGVDDFLRKGQIGSMSNLIKILEMDIDKKWDGRIQDTLDKIKEHIEKHGIYKGYIYDLNKELQRLPSGFEKMKEDIPKLMEEKKFKI